MSVQNYSINFSAVLSSASGAAAGFCGVLDATGTGYLVGSTANRGTRKCDGVFLTGGDAGGSVVIQSNGFIPASITGLGALAGPPQYALVSSTGSLARSVAASALSVGTIDEFGNAHVDFSGSGSGTAAATGFSPLTYGCLWDGVNDDLAGWNLMMLAMPVTGGVVNLPPGYGWFSDDVHVHRGALIQGSGGGTDAHNSGFELAPGKKVVLDDALSSSDGVNANGAILQTLDITSRLLARDTGSNLVGGKGIRQTFSAGAVVRAGDCYISSSGSSQRFYRASVGGTFGASEPAFSAAIGGTVTSNGIVWTTEAFPQLYAKNTAYTVGQRIWIPNDNRWYFECSIAGTSSTTAYSTDFDSAVPGATVVDGGATFVCKIAPGIQVSASYVNINRVYITHVTNAGVHVQSNGATIFADNTRMHEVLVDWAGLGVYLVGIDTNCWTIDGLWTLHCGWALAYAQGFDPANSPYGNEGGHAIHDHSFAGGMISNLSCQTSTGRPILRDGAGLLTVLSCYDEVALDCKFPATGGSAIILGGDVSGELAHSSTITSSTNATPIVITKAAHGFTTGSTVTVAGHATNTAANGTWKITVLSANTYSLNGSIGNGIGINTGATSMGDDVFVIINANGANGLSSADSAVTSAAIYPGPITATLGNRDGKSAFTWKSGLESAPNHLTLSDTLTGWPVGWWVTNWANSQVLGTFATPGPQAKWPSGATFGLGDQPCWAMKGILIGEYNADPCMIDFGAAAPTAITKRYVKGSVRWNSAMVAGDPVGWACTVTGSPGTWVAMANL